MFEIPRICMPVAKLIAYTGIRFARTVPRNEILDRFTCTKGPFKYNVVKRVVWWDWQNGYVIQADASTVTPRS